MDVFYATVLELAFWLLLGSTEPNGLPPLDANTMLDGVPSSCQILLFADTRGAQEGLELLDERWTRHEFLGAVPDVTEGATLLRSRLAELAATSVSWWGFDPFADVESVTLCFNLGAGSGGLPAPRTTIVLRGGAGLSDGLRLRAASMRGLVPVPGYDAFHDTVTDTIVAFRAPGWVVWGPSAEIEVQLAAAALPLPAAGSINARLAELSATDVRRFAGYDPGLALSFLIAAFYTQSMAQHSANLDIGLVAANDDTLYFEARALSDESLADYRIMLDGVGRLAMALPILFEGLTDLLLGSVEPGDTAFSPQVLALAEHRDEVMALLEGSGAFELVTVAQSTDEAGRVTSLTVENARGLQLLLTQLAMLTYLAAEGWLPATLHSFEDIPLFWGHMLGD